MILLISTCTFMLSQREFVDPIASTLGAVHQIKHYTDDFDPNKYEKIIICGTALADNEYLKHIERFDWLKNYDKPLLGICSGMQILALQYSASIFQQKEIGMIDIDLKRKNPLILSNMKAYALHNNGVKDLDQFEILAQSKDGVQAIRKRFRFGIMFHPEVRNQEIIRRFAKIQ